MGSVALCARSRCYLYYTRLQRAMRQARASWECTTTLARRALDVKLFTLTKIGN